MKKNIFPFLVLCLAPALLPAQVSYTLSGKVGGLNAPAKVLLRYTTITGEAVSDSAILQEGGFEFKGNIAGPVRAGLVLYHDGARTGRGADALSFYLEEGNIRVTSADSLVHAVVAGSKVNEDNKRLQAALKPVTDKSAVLMEAYRGYTPEQKKDTAFMAVFGKKYEAVSEERKQVYRKFIQDNPGSFVSLDAIRMAVGAVPEYKDIAPLFALLSPEVKGSAGGKLFGEKIDRLKSVDVGRQAPDFTQNDPNGVPVTLSSFRGKYVLIDFWASWCGPCRAENPNVVKIYSRYKDRNFTVLGVSLDQPGAKEKWVKAIADDHLDWTQVSDLRYWKNAVAQQYEVQAIPQNFLVDPQGKIVGRNLRGEELEKKLAELISL